jgi:hypothetical protein
LIMNATATVTKATDDPVRSGLTFIGLSSKVSEGSHDYGQCAAILQNAAHSLIHSFMNS